MSLIVLRTLISLLTGRGSSVSLEHNGKLADDMSIKSTFSFRDDHRYGLWTDAYPSWNENQEEYSFITMTETL